MLKPDHPSPPDNSGHYAEAAQRFLEAKERYWVGSESWAVTTAAALHMLTQEDSTEVAKPEWWNDEGLKALSARVVSAAPDDLVAHQVRAEVLSGLGSAWEAGPRSSAELKEAAMHFERAASLCCAPAAKANLAAGAASCRRQADALRKSPPKLGPTFRPPPPDFGLPRAQVPRGAPPAAVRPLQLRHAEARRASPLVPHR